MAIEDVKQLRTVNGVTQAQQLLDEGWSILAVCVIQDGNSQYAEYHLGKAAESTGNAGVFLPKRMRD
ncbi:hypothetical protein [Pseudomonas fluorescens]|uniref:hypothetical protein n=1 Tax=Pseudomonas fluorescens TaxID=294 RepID=UPI00124999ED|nr:hypothetical protein [Pseudomonas fluorescens]CAG8866724.1 hypothetical protein PS861_01638 [Pseudomonas fluorescens]